MIRNTSTAPLSSWLRKKVRYGVRGISTWPRWLCTVLLHNPVRSRFLPNQIEPASHEVRAKTPIAQLPDTPPGATTYDLSTRGSSSNTRSRQPIHDTGFLGLLSSPAAVPPPLARGIEVSIAPLGPGIHQHRRSHSDSGLPSLPSRHNKPYYKSYQESFPTFTISAVRPSVRGMESGRVARNEKSPVQIA